MTSVAFRALNPALAAVTLLTLLAGPTAVQARNPYRRAVVPAPSPYWGYAWNPYGWWDPYASELHGVASIIQAQGDFLVKSQQALLLRENVRRERLNTRKAELLHWEWERDFQAASFNRREARYFKSALDRSLAPTLSTGEIINAGPLNTLLTQLELLRELPADGSTPIPADALAKIQFNVDGRGNAGLLKQDRLRWPQLLYKPDFKEDREAITRLFKQAQELGFSEKADSELMADTLSSLRHRLKDVRGRFTELMRSPSNALDPDWSTTYCRLAQNFFDDVDASIRLLSKHDPSFYLGSLQGNTVAELVKYMKGKGIMFDRGMGGSESQYKVLYDALAGEYRRLQPTLKTTNP